MKKNWKIGWDRVNEAHYNHVKEIRKIYRLLGMSKIKNDIDYVRFVITRQYLISKKNYLIRSLDECYHSHLIQEKSLSKISRMVIEQEKHIASLLKSA